MGFDRRTDGVAPFESRKVVVISSCVLKAKKAPLVAGDDAWITIVQLNRSSRWYVFVCQCVRER